jgi:hypothetical protein
MNPKHSTLAQHNTVPCSLRLGAGGSGMIADSGWRYFDVQMYNKRRLGTFVTEIKMTTLAAAPRNHWYIFCVMCYSFQYTDIQYWAVRMLQVILWHQQITKKLKMFPCAAAHTADCLIRDCDTNQWTECSIILREKLSHFQLLNKTPTTPLCKQL